jgi:hypothetical protein
MKIKKVFIKTAICLFLFSIFVDTVLLEISLLFPKNIEVASSSSNHFRNILDETAKQQKSSQKTVDEADVRAGRVDKEVNVQL